MKYTLTFLIILLVSLVCGPVAAQAESDAGGPLIPSIAGEWWRAAYSPELPELDSKRGEIVDHTFFRDADGTWQLWTQIRGTRHDRVFFQWTGSTDFENDKQAWKPHRVCWVGDPHAGEMPRTIQAPHCYSEDGRWHMFYGGGGSISRADSDDGHVFIRARNSDGFSRLFADLSNRTPSGMRDPYLFKADDGRYHLYYTWKDHVMARTADRPDAAEWSEGVIVSTTPNASQCPTVVRIGNWYYLFKMGGSGKYRTAVYASRDPLDFGGVEAKPIATLPASAAEVLQIGDRWYISSLIPHRNGEGRVIGHAGVRLAPIEWKPASPGEVGKLPAFKGPIPGVKREIDMPLVDLSADKGRHSVVAAGTNSVYQGHCDTVLLPDGKTMFTAWCLGHARWIGPIAKSTDSGCTWSQPLDVPDNWKETSNTPALHRLIAPDGTARLFCFADGLDWSRQGKPPYPMHQAYSEDDGQTWTPMIPNGVEGEVPPKTIHAFDKGKRLVMWSDLPGYVVQSESLDGGLTWSRSRRILRVPNRWSQPCVIRSADGRTHLMLLRENSRKYQSLYSVSHDDAKTWTEPRELPATLTGDRHVAKFASDGRLVVAFRDVAKSSSTYGHYLAWVGRFEDILEGKPGDYRVKLFHNTLRKGSDKPGTGNADCGYSDLELLPDGTIVATTYLKYAPGPEKHSVMNTRFTLTETDSLAKEVLKAR